MKPLRVINSLAPIRICDNGGWTDTWFAEYGRIFNIAVTPNAEVQIEVYPADGDENRVMIFAENFGESYTIHPEANQWDRHPLLEASIAYMGVPQDLRLQITVYSEAPSGASTGTSAAVAVALIAALDRLTPGQLTPHEIAYAAQSIETKQLGLQCGIQDQLASAYGGINFIDMYNYPHASVSQIDVPEHIWRELERRLVLIYLGKSHESSKIHEKVIKELEDAGPECKQIHDLRKTAELSRDAVYAGDFSALGCAMIDNTNAQGRLHPELISNEAWQIIEIAKSYGAIGWKVNGAGGEGGSLTLLCSSVSHQKRAMIKEIEQENPFFKHIPTHLSHYGVRTWEQ